MLSLDLRGSLWPRHVRLCGWMCAAPCCRSCGTLLPHWCGTLLLRPLRNWNQLDVVTGLERLVVAAVVSLPENIVDVADAV